jgi:hypothetical protein
LWLSDARHRKTRLAKSLGAPHVVILVSMQSNNHSNKDTPKKIDAVNFDRVEAVRYFQTGEARERKAI